MFIRDNWRGVHSPAFYSARRELNSPRLRLKVSVRARPRVTLRAMNRKWSVTIVGRLFRDDLRRGASYPVIYLVRRDVDGSSGRIRIRARSLRLRPPPPPRCSNLLQPAMEDGQASAVSAVAGTAILSHPFSFYRIIYHQRSRSLLHSTKTRRDSSRPTSPSLSFSLPLSLSLAFKYSNVPAYFHCLMLSPSPRFFLLSKFSYVLL